MILGLVFLYFYAQEINLKVDVSEPNPATAETVHIQGIVSKIQTTPKAIFFTLEGKKVEKTSVILFTPEPVFLQEGDYVDLYGTVQDYQGQKEVIANKVSKK